MKTKMQKQHYYLIIACTIVIILIAKFAPYKESQPTQAPSAAMPLTAQQEVSEKENAQSELAYINEWFDISKQLEDSLDKINENIKTVQAGKISAKEMMKPTIDIRKELLTTHQNTTMLNPLNNQALYDAKKIYYNETDNIWLSVGKVLDWLTEVDSDEIEMTDTTILDDYKKEISAALEKIKNTELTVRKVESETRKKAEQ